MFFSSDWFSPTEVAKRRQEWRRGTQECVRHGPAAIESTGCGWCRKLSDIAVKLPPRSPNLNAHAERFVRTIKESCLERMILFGEESLRTAIHNFAAHYHTERNHQGWGNRLIIPQAGHLVSAGPILLRQRLGGMLNYYFRAAA